MRSLVVLFTLVAVAVAAPYGGQYYTYHQPGPFAYVVPAAVSQQSRIDYKTPVVAAEQLVATAPIVTGGLAVAPTFYTANPNFGVPLATNYYSGQSVVSPFVAPGAVFAIY